MEVLRGIKIRTIFLDKHNWWRFYQKYKALIREDIVSNVCLVLACNTGLLGFHEYQCPDCEVTKKVFHTCKSRFCSSCGKKATEQWIEKNMSVLPEVPWQHITFTFPAELRDLFWLNRHLFNHLTKIPARIITKLAKQKHLLPGIFLAVHTFGRDLKANVHFHVSTTTGGLSLNKKSWIPSFYLHHQHVKKMWRYAVITTLRRMFKSKQLQLPTALQQIRNYTEFNRWLETLYQKSWVVHLQKPCADQGKNVKYLGRYLKRPPISEMRITKYDGENVTYYYHDHHENNKKSITLTVFDFIKRLIRHIPDRNFRLVRYYNWLSNRTRGKELPLVYTLIKQQQRPIKKITWQSLFKSSFGYDPLWCRKCKAFMKLVKTVFAPSRRMLVDMHGELATSAA